MMTYADILEHFKEYYPNLKDKIRNYQPCGANTIRIWLGTDNIEIEVQYNEFYNFFTLLPPKGQSSKAPEIEETESQLVVPESRIMDLEEKVQKLWQYHVDEMEARKKELDIQFERAKQEIAVQKSNLQLVNELHGIPFPRAIYPHGVHLDSFSGNLCSYKNSDL